MSSKTHHQKFPKLVADYARRLKNASPQYRELLGGLSYGDSAIIFSAADFHLADLAYKDIKRRLRYDRAVRRYNAAITKLTVSAELRHSERIKFVTERDSAGQVAVTWTSPTMYELYDSCLECVKNSPYIAASMRSNSHDERRAVRSLTFDDVTTFLEEFGEYTTPHDIEEVARHYVEHLSEL